MINIVNKVDCCGCEACYNACPNESIRMKSDEEGFLYPQVNQDTCVNCGLCEKVCPISNCETKKNENQVAYIQYILECLKENSTQIRNIKQYLLATLYNAPVTVDSYYSAQVRHEFGWSGRVDKN